MYTHRWKAGLVRASSLAICAYTMVVKKAVSKCSWKPREELRWHYEKQWLWDVVKRL